MIISLVAAADENNVIGMNNALPWKLPADMKFFKNLTMGHAVIMGRKTFESIGCKPLSGRTNVVITRNKSFHTEPNILIFSNLNDALKALVSEKEIFVIGGAEIFREAMPKASIIYLTRINFSFEGDSFFPEIVENEWIEVGRTNHEPDKDNAYRYSFIKLARKNGK